MQVSLLSWKGLELVEWLDGFYRREKRIGVSKERASFIDFIGEATLEHETRHFTNILELLHFNMSCIGVELNTFQVSCFSAELSASVSCRRLFDAIIFYHFWLFDFNGLFIFKLSI